MVGSALILAGIVVGQCYATLATGAHLLRSGEENRAHDLEP